MTDFVDRVRSSRDEHRRVRAGYPTAAMIIHRADMFGLALPAARADRPRQATRYAYLTLPPGRILSSAAESVYVMQTLDTLGAGFLWPADLDIEGAGNLLGEEQSGHPRGRHRALPRCWRKRWRRRTWRARAETTATGGLGAADQPRHGRTDRGLRPRPAFAWASIGDCRSWSTSARSTPSPPNWSTFRASAEEVQNLLDVIDQAAVRDAGVEKVDTRTEGRRDRLSRACSPTRRASCSSSVPGRDG